MKKYFNMGFDIGAAVATLSIILFITIISIAINGTFDDMTTSNIANENFEVNEVKKKQNSSNRDIKIKNISSGNKDIEVRKNYSPIDRGQFKYKVIELKENEEATINFKKRDSIIIEYEDNSLYNRPAIFRVVAIALIIIVLLLFIIVKILPPIE